MSAFTITKNLIPASYLRPRFHTPPRKTVARDADLGPKSFFCNTTRASYTVMSSSMSPVHAVCMSHPHTVVRHVAEQRRRVSWSAHMPVGRSMQQSHAFRWSERATAPPDSCPASPGCCALHATPAPGPQKQRGEAGAAEVRQSPAQLGLQSAAPVTLTHCTRRCRYAAAAPLALRTVFHRDRCKALSEAGQLRATTQSSWTMHVVPGRTYVRFC